MKLPVDYLEQMKELLGEEFPKFLASYEEKPERSLRVNRLKLPPERLAELTTFHLEPVPWCQEAYYYQHEPDRPGKHPYHAAGLYYIQDASAMSPAEALEAKPGERILDLCAAPGGKTTQLAAKMQGEGILVANEIDRKRAGALVENLERCGVSNAVVLTENPTKMTKRFYEYFDRILIDAPCSGEGMFRKDPATMERWSSRLPEKCAELQKEILTAAIPMLQPGGRLVYSTCTFNPLENEQIVDWILEEYPEFQIVAVPQLAHYQPGRPEWSQSKRDELRLTGRLWPHHLRGEGHFVAVLEKKAEELPRKKRLGKGKPLSPDAKKLLEKFWKETFPEPLTRGYFVTFGEHLYLLPEEFPSIEGLKVEKPGFYLGQLKRSHFQPSHALALASHPENVRHIRNYEANSDELRQYLQGDTLQSEGNGWTLVTVDHFPIGWGKASGGYLKNHYPKWLRWDRV